MITQTQIDEVVRRIVEGYQPEKIILFGSYADGTATEDSDIDLLIIKETDEDSLSRRLKVGKLLRKLTFPIDTLIYNSQEFTFNVNDKHSFISSILPNSKLLFVAV
ncbi:MAG: nucleotidyltransferase domain-containing protein [Cytophagales bacterium]